MVTDSLRRGLGLLSRNPYLWLPGLVAGCLGALDILLQFSYGTFLATRLWILEALLIPFLLAGAYSLMKTGDQGYRAFLSGGMKYYFRILLPALLIAFVVLATVILVSIPLLVVGAVETILPFIVIGCTIPIIFFAFFADTAAVFEDKGIFECIRRSVEVVLNRAGSMIGFFLVCMGIIILVGLPLAVIWTGLLYDSLLPLSTMDPSQIQSFTIEMLNEMLGPTGIQITAIVYCIAMTVLSNILYVFKAAFYQKTIGEVILTTPPSLQGEYDEKGRWYKY